MAYLKQPKSDEEVKKLTLSGVKKAYSELSKDYLRLLDGDYIYCGKCNSFLSRDTFYSSNAYASGKFPVCKKCLMLMATDYDKKTNTYTDNKEKTQETLRFLDLPFIESAYNSALSSVQAEVNERNRGTAWQQYITMVQSLPNWKGLRWKDSDVDIDQTINEEEVKLNQKTIKAAKKRFGAGIYTNEQYMFLENEYQDWTSRYSCENKAQELLFQRICCKELEINEAQKSGKDTKELDKTLQELMGSLRVKPSQSNADALTESLTFGQLIEKWENESPIPDPDPELEDVDGLKAYVEYFFKGHLAKMMGLKNAYTEGYDEYMAQYSVKKPEYEEDEGSDAIYNKLFGKEVE